MDTASQINYVLAVIALFALLTAILLGYVAFTTSKLNYELNAENNQLKADRHPSAVETRHDLFKLAGINDEDAETMRQAWRDMNRPLVDYWQPSLLGDDTLRMLQA